MGITVIDNRKKGESIEIKKNLVRKICKAVLERLDIKNASLSIVFMNREDIKNYNKTYRGVDRETDVLSFPSGGSFDDSNYMGDIIICPEVVYDNAKLYNNEFNEELALVIIHGILHLLGYRDYSPEESRQMELLQEELLNHVRCLW